MGHVEMAHPGLIHVSVGWYGLNLELTVGVDEVQQREEKR